MHRLVRAWRLRGDTRGAIARLELCLTPCIVTHPPGTCDALLCAEHVRPRATVLYVRPRAAVLYVRATRTRVLRACVSCVALC